MATPLTPPGTLFSATGLDSTPEYLTLRRSYKAVITHVKEQTGTICDSLFEKGYISTTVRDFVRSIAHSDEEKAEKLIDTVVDKVKHDRSVYCGFLEILKTEGPLAKSIIARLEECFAVAESELAVQQIPAEVAAISTGGNEQEAREQKGRIEIASETVTKRVLVTVDKREDSKKILHITDHTLHNLTEDIRKKFGLDTHCVITLQLWDAKFRDFVPIKDMNEIQDNCKINAAITKQAQTPQVVYCNCALFGQPSPPGNTVPRKQRNTIPRSRGASGARIVHDKLWKGRQVLKVFFKNPEFIRMWKCRNEPMTTTNILAWAAIWNHPFHSDTIPTLEMTEHIDDSDIRVQFQEEASGCWSMVGTDAVGKDVTMVLDLSRHPSNVQRSLVIHEFGHALGLEHEHQRSDFWDIVGKHFDLEKMRKDPRVRAPESGDEQGGVGCETDWETKTGGDEEEYTSEYDSKSIMHYCFDVKWLKGDFSTYANIDKDQKLSDKEKKYLKAIHQRSGIGPLPKEPSKLDIQELVKVYESGTTGPRQKPPLKTSENFQNPTSNQYVTLDDAHTEEQDTQKTNIWAGRPMLNVFFMNPNILKEWANGTTIGTIMAWASSWNSPFYKHIPRFEETNDVKTADIRVMFSDSSGSWSAVGTGVQKVKKMEPTMMLDLKSFDRSFKRYLVIHQFGHALGLEHEHQRTDFWDGIKKHIDTEKMRNDKSTGNYTSPDAFKRDWLELGVKTHRESAIPYDPQSIMHWWFAVNWLKDPEYHELENVKSDSSLTDDEKRFLEGIHARNRKYVPAPSKSDIEYLEEVYSQNPKEQFNAVEFKKLIEQVDVNKIKGIWRSTTDETDSDQAEHTWKKIAQATAEANMELFREIGERCSK